ncbi:MalY/PatB family protein [Ferrimonas aestuarii]|uniref:cysteine-S-conjugate beta-lyase n=1 Tax=Ferrimonas aestuarii TaxID=2569539 RepID=A0A4U1BMJ0_9GAMM|nr:PatB family C-S lyase [Ferrimonas aestuarii]TKB52771.1 putative C-S lyase [Ferrimonas aestuarii]
MHWDSLIERRGSDSLKWQRYQDESVLPMWVADMDFAIPDPVVDAIAKRAAHPVYGYGVISNETKGVICDWLARRWQVSVAQSHLVSVPAVVPGFNYLAQGFSKVGYFTPSYPPIAQVAANLKIESVAIALEAHEEAGKRVFPMPLAQLETAAQQGMDGFILCNPHNPGGTIWTEEELKQLVALSRRYGFEIISDEIHGDLIMPGNQHRSLLNYIGPDDKAAVLVSSGKSFNLAGLPQAFAIVPNSEQRLALKQRLSGFAPAHNVLAITAMEAAYRHGEPWLDSLREYLWNNWLEIDGKLGAMPQLTLMTPQATYLAWIDCRALGWADPVKVFESYGVGLSCGADFGSRGFVRLNFACPKSRLQIALSRMQKAITEYQG